MLSALWLAPVVLWLSRGYADPQEGPLDLVYFGLTALFWIGHRLCSTYLAYCTEAYRPLLRSQPLRFVVVPLAVTAACFAVFLPSDAALPWTRGERVVALAIIDYVCVTYHFAAQHFGALSLYRMRIGRAAGGRTRTIDRLFAVGVGGVLVVLADVLAGAVAYQDRWVDLWLGPAWLSSAQDEIRIGATAVLLVATAAMVAAELHASQRSLPRVLYVLGLAIMVCYLYLDIGVYGTLWIIFIAYVTRFLPYGMRYNSASFWSSGRRNTGSWRRVSPHARRSRRRRRRAGAYGACSTP